MCCLFGLLDPNQTLTGPQKTRLLHLLATAAEVRGTDASGIAYNTKNKLVIRKAPVSGHALRFRIPDDTIAVMGHARMTTQWDEIFNRNNHPFLGNTPARAFALAHNGILHNGKELRRKLRLPHTPIQTDSYIAVQLIEHKRSLDFSSLKYMAETVEGSFTFTVLDAADNLWIVKGDNPLSLWRFPGGMYVYASTVEILSTALRGFGIPAEGAEKIQIDSGEIVKIGRDGIITRGSFDDSRLYAGAWGWYPRCAPTSPMDELKSAAVWMGYPPEMVDRYAACGYGLEEIEELLYEGEI